MQIIVLQFSNIVHARCTKNIVCHLLTTIYEQNKLTIELFRIRSREHLSFVKIFVLVRILYRYQYKSIDNTFWRFTLYF